MRHLSRWTGRCLYAGALLLLAVACHGGHSDPDPGGGTPSACAASGQAGLLKALGDARLVADTSADIGARLSAIPGMSVQENPSGVKVPTDYRFFLLQYTQPADHAHPECQTFTQRLTLLHTSDTAPMVLYTGGYYLSPTSTSRRELTALLGSNQLTVEHRFFEPSRPHPTDWSLLTIEQSASDFHRVVQALKPIYGGHWVSTGGSKGGETVTFFRRFYPEDVDATVAYVAPITHADDERFPSFEDAVGGAARQDCREHLHTFLRGVLARRAELVPLLGDYAQRNALTYTRLGFDKALEHAVIETYFAFWQYDSPDNCDQFPAVDASGQALLDALDAEAGLNSFADTGPGSIDYYAPYYYQAAAELGWPRPYESFLGELIQFPDTDTGPGYSEVPVLFRDPAMRDVQDWVSTQGERLMFIYGELDPWSSAAYSLGGARDSFVFQVPGGNHGSSIDQLPEPQHTQAIDTVRRWAGVAQTTMPHHVMARGQPQFEPFAPHLPPRLRAPSTTR